MKPLSEEPGWQLWQATPEEALHVFVAGHAEAGPTLLVSAGIHGDEYEGPAAVAAITRALHNQVLMGRVLLVPVMNPMAWLTGTRCTQEDGKNLARCFPGREDGTITDRLAASIFEHLVLPSDFLIDLHSGGVEYVFLPVAGFYGETEPANASFLAARHFGLSSLWQLPITPGVLSCEAMLRGKVAIGHEYLGAGQLSKEGATAYERGILNCLRHRFMLKDSVVEPPPDQRCFTGDWQIAGANGLFISQVSLGARVEKGALLAEIFDERGRSLEAVYASIGGEVLGLRSKAHIAEGAWAVLLGKRVDFV